MSERLQNRDILPMKVKHFLKKEYDESAQQPNTEYWKQVAKLQADVDDYASYLATTPPNSTISDLRAYFLGKEGKLGIEYARPDLELRALFQKKDMDLPQDAAVVLLIIRSQELSIDLGTLMVAFNDERVIDWFYD